MKVRAATILLIGCLAGVVFAQEESDEQLILEALHPLPNALRDETTVVAWNDAGERRVVRKGTNNWICHSDLPGPGYIVSCYPKSLDAFEVCKRSKRLKGINRDEAWGLCEEEIDEGKFSMPDYAIQLIVFGTSRKTALPLSIIRIPYATGESTDLPTEPDSFHPWVHNPGTLDAHIMFP